MAAITPVNTEISPRELQTLNTLTKSISAGTSHTGALGFQAKQLMDNLQKDPGEKDLYESHGKNFKKIATAANAYLEKVQQFKQSIEAVQSIPLKSILENQFEIWNSALTELNADIKNIFAKIFDDLNSKIIANTHTTIADLRAFRLDSTDLSLEKAKSSLRELGSRFTLMRSLAENCNRIYNKAQKDQITAHKETVQNLENLIDPPDPQNLTHLMHRLAIVCKLPPEQTDAKETLTKKLEKTIAAFDANFRRNLDDKVSQYSCRRLSRYDDLSIFRRAFTEAFQVKVETFLTDEKSPHFSETQLKRFYEWLDIHTFGGATVDQLPAVFEVAESAIAAIQETGKEEEDTQEAQQTDENNNNSSLARMEDEESHLTRATEEMTIQEDTDTKFIKEDGASSHSSPTSEKNEGSDIEENPDEYDSKKTESVHSSNASTPSLTEDIEEATAEDNQEIAIIIQDEHLQDQEEIIAEVPPETTNETAPIVETEMDDDIVPELEDVPDIVSQTTGTPAIKEGKEEEEDDDAFEFQITSTAIDGNEPPHLNVLNRLAELA